MSAASYKNPVDFRSPDRSQSSYFFPSLFLSSLESFSVLFLQANLGECFALWFALTPPPLKWLTEQKNPFEVCKLAARYNEFGCKCSQGRPPCEVHKTFAYSFNKLHLWITLKWFWLQTRAIMALAWNWKLLFLWWNEWATSEFQKPSLSKWGQVHNLSCENEFYFHENKKSFPYQRLST